MNLKTLLTQAGFQDDVWGRRSTVDLQSADFQEAQFLLARSLSLGVPPSKHEFENPSDPMQVFKTMR